MVVTKYLFVLAVCAVNGFAAPACKHHKPPPPKPVSYSSALPYSSASVLPIATSSAAYPPPSTSASPEEQSSSSVVYMPPNPTSIADAYPTGSSSWVPYPPGTFKPNAPMPTDDIGKAFTDHNTYVKRMVDSVNVQRIKHHSQPIKWNETLARAAWDTVQNCGGSHSGIYAQNMAWGWLGPETIAPYWCTEEDNYDYNNPNWNQAGHFVNLIWNSTTDIGCATQWCGDRGGSNWETACNFWTAQSYGDIRQNVQRP